MQMAPLPPPTRLLLSSLHNPPPMIALIIRLLLCEIPSSNFSKAARAAWEGGREGGGERRGGRRRRRGTPSVASSRPNTFEPPTLQNNAREGQRQQQVSQFQTLSYRLGYVLNKLNNTVETLTALRIKFTLFSDHASWLSG